MSTLLLGNYEHVLHADYAHKIPVDVYRSRRTGLHVAVAKAPGPVVACNIVVPTEVETNDGLPHTLEHLVFMGSRSIPFKGALDLMALKAMALSGGTNAYTALDHTTYYVKTLGAGGMRKFVRVYADHLINPLLTPKNYASEVYHVNADGEEAGVVYSEIQGYENELDVIVDRKLSELVFPNNPSFFVQFGGRTKEVREMCSLKRVQDYHRHFYNLRNMWIALCGTFELEPMLREIDELDAAPENRPPASFERPFLNAHVPELTRSRKEIEVVRAPSGSADEAVVHFGFMGRSAKELEYLYAVEVLGSYLTTTTSAPLQREMILIDKPFADSVSMALNVLPRSLISLGFSGVPLDRVDALPDKFFDVLRATTKKEALDLDRIRSILQQSVKKIYASLDSDISPVIFYGLIGHQLYADRLDDQKHFQRALNPLPIYEELLQKPVDYWADLMAELFTDRCAVVVGRPDPELAQQKAAEEAERLKQLKQKIEAGEVERTKLDEKDVSKLPSMEMFDDVGPEQAVEKFRISSAFLTDEAPSPLLSALPFGAVLHDVDSRFIRAYFLFDLKRLPPALRKWSMILTELLFKSPTTIDGRPLSDEQTADLMTKELMSQHAGLGFSSTYQHLLTFSLEVTAKDFDLVPKWSRALLRDTKFEAPKVLAIAKNLTTGASAKKRDVDSMISLLIGSVNYEKNHESRFCNDFVLQEFHREVAKRIELGEQEAAKVVAELEAFRAAILEAPLNVHFICNPKLVEGKSKAESWSFLDQKKPVEKLTMTREADVAPFLKWTPASRLLQVDGGDATHVLCRSQTRVEFGSDEHVAILTMGSYFSMIEGELWIGIRGKGLAYCKFKAAFLSSSSTSAPSLRHSPAHECLTLLLYRCSRPVLAYDASKDLVTGLFNRTAPLDPLKFDLAKRSAVCNLLSRYKTLKSTADHAAFDVLRGRTSEQIDRLAAQIWKADAERVLQLARPHFLRLFDERQHLLAVAGPRNKLDEIKGRFPAIQTVEMADLQYTPE
ncbi:Peptidase M16 inactive domain protein [Aphelenchoides fujianensis]|nr:Peptidase M16 inactive domain protein [Aphelenchoides fujianensis]